MGIFESNPALLVVAVIAIVEAWTVLKRVARWLKYEVRDFLRYGWPKDV